MKWKLNQDVIFWSTNEQIDPKIRVEVSQRVDYACIYVSKGFYLCDWELLNRPLEFEKFDVAIL